MYINVHGYQNWRALVSLIISLLPGLLITRDSVWPVVGRYVTNADHVTALPCPHTHLASSIITVNHNKDIYIAELSDFAKFHNAYQWKVPTEISQSPVDSSNIYRDT